MLLLICVALAACGRSGPPAPLLSCRTVQGTVEIDGAAEPAISTYCRDGKGDVSLGH
jgi:hypothetical protein